MREETFFIWILFTSILLFMVGGACLFNFLEASAELESHRYYDKLFSDFLVKHNISKILMKDFEDVHRKGCAIGVPNKAIKKWDYIGSFSFVGTILTTIGTSIRE